MINTRIFCLKQTEDKLKQEADWKVKTEYWIDMFDKQL